MHQTHKQIRAHERMMPMAPAYHLALTLHQGLSLTFDQIAIIMMIPVQSAKQLVAHAIESSVPKVELENGSERD